MPDFHTQDSLKLYVSLRGISKSFPGVLANDNIDLDIYNSEIHALLGENGAGKSTLMKILYGFYRADSGTILYKGKPYTIRSPLDARTIQLIQTAISVGAASKGGVRSHVRRALNEGATAEEILQVVLLATNTIGFPAMIASYGWAKDVLDSKE